VDDHAGFRAMARLVLESDGFDVVGEAESGVSALRAARELEPDVVVLDVRLPDFDGFEVAERLGALRGGGPAVVLTSSRDPSDLGLAAAPPTVRGFIPKGELSGKRVAELLGD
jgi:DNA-binding NarL/FixJ family response regulator